MLTIYKASAGSGKTFQLARKYIQLLLGYKNQYDGKWRLYPKSIDAHRGILAITFTNKATAEMKRRIIDELSLLADEDNRKKSDHLDYFKALFGASETEIGKSAEAALESLLTNFRDFNVSTIDSFFQTVLRTFAHELDLPDNFELKLDDSEVVALAVEDMLNTVNGSSTLLEEKPSKEEVADIRIWLRKYMSLMLMEGKNFNIFNKNGHLQGFIIKLITSMMDERFKENFDDIASWCSNLKKINEFEEYLIRQSETHKKILNICAQEIKALPDTFLKKDIVNIANKIISGEDIDKGKTWEKFKDGITDADAYKSFFKVAFFNPKNYDEQLFGKFCTLCVTIYDEYTKLNLYQLLLKNIYPLGIFGQVLKRIEAFRRKKSAFLLSDTNNFLHKIIGGEDTPFIYERLGTRLKHFLLDEFQDTSRLQWSNLRPLLIESLSTDNDNLIIGDEKQCIYRFRNSDPALINSIVKQEILERFDAVEERGTEVNENTNWRSDRQIVEFNNDLFNSLSSRLNLNDYYTNTKQGTKSPEERGYVNVLFTEGLEDYDFKFSEIKDDKTYAENIKIALDRLAQHIQRQLKSGYKPSQIAVLVRTKGEGEIVIRTMLELFETIPFEHKPEIVSGDALKLGESPAVRYIVSRMKLFLLPDTPEADELMDSEYLNKPEEERRKLEYYFKKLENRRKTRLFMSRYHVENVSETEKADKNSMALRDSLLSLDSSENNGAPNTDSIISGNLVTLAENILNEYLDKIAIDLKVYQATNENVYVSTFLDKVIEYATQEGNNLEGFIEWWEDKGKETGVILTENDNAVKVSTIHKSKGLEYDCVHIPFVNFDLYAASRRRGFYWYKITKNEIGESDFIPKYMRLGIDNNVRVSKSLERQLEVLLDEDKLDALNVLYVAFTRAVSELIVTVTGSLKSDMSKMDTKISGPLLESMHDLFSGDERFFEFGVPTFPKDKKKKDKENVINLVMPPYRTNGHKTIDELTKPINLDRLNWHDAVARGNFFHEVLSRTAKWGSMEYAARLTGYKYRLAPAQIAETENILNDAFDNLKFKKWFEDYDALLNELPVYNFQEFSERMKRPDRIVLYSDGSVDVVDYKFANPEEENRSQVKEYMDFFKSIGYKTVRGYLWYPLRKKVEEI